MFSAISAERKTMLAKADAQKKKLLNEWYSTFSMSYIGAILYILNSNCKHIQPVNLML